MDHLLIDLLCTLALVSITKDKPLSWHKIELKMLISGWTDALVQFIYPNTFWLAFSHNLFFIQH